MSPALAGGFFTTSATWEAQYTNKYIVFLYSVTFPGGWDGKESACSAGDPGLILGQEDSLEEGMATTPVFLPGESHEQMRLAGYGSWGPK